jgi:hypothetical protein
MGGIMTMKRYSTAIFLVLVIVCFCCSCSKNEDSAKQNAGVAGDVLGPAEIPRNEISPKYGWDGSTWLKPSGKKSVLQLRSKGNVISYELLKNGSLAKRFEKVGDGYVFSGQNIQIGNLIFEGNFTWSDEKITLEKGAKMRKVVSAKVK